jgi:SAM-dependent methyltransferase
MAPRPSPTSPSTPEAAEPVPLAVWPCAQTTGHAQRAGRYVAATTAHPAKMLPELARRITCEYAPPGALVVDPMCGIGTTLVEATGLGRRSVGVELEARWAELARRNLAVALPAERAVLAEVRTGDARRLPELLGDLAGTVDLIATSPPYACTPAMIDKAAWRQGGRLCRRDTENYSADPANLGHARGEAYLAEMASVYAACFHVLRPGGLLVTVTRNLRRQGRVFDLAAATVTLAEQAGYQYLQHVLALLAAVRDSALFARPSFWQLYQTRRARDRGEPASLLVHEDVQVFQKPLVATATQRSRPATRRAAPQPRHRHRARSAAADSSQSTAAAGARLHAPQGGAR